MKNETLTWSKVDHFTNKPYKRDNSGDWHIVDYISGDFRISELPNGDRELTKGGRKLGIFKTLKAAKAYAETI